jgi:hypothetical protein
MKLLNYDKKALIMHNVRSDMLRIPDTYTKAQYRILCRLIITKKISKQFFDLLLTELYSLTDWKQLSYQQMYELIHILTYYNYKKEENQHE